MSEAVWIATAGIAGTLSAGLLTSWFTQKWATDAEERRQKARDAPYRTLLLPMLESPKFGERSEARLQVVTGLAREDLARILIGLGARGVRMADGSQGWALLSRNPLPDEA